MTGRHHGRWLATSLLLASVAVGAPASAQEKGAPAQEATKLYEEGVKAARAGQWEKARAALLAAFERTPDSKTAANLGLVELMAGKPRDAAEHLSFFLREARDVSPQDRQATEELLAKAKAKIGTVTIRVNVDRAEVLVDGRSVGMSPLAGPVFLEPGSRKIEAAKGGFTSSREELEVAADSAPVVELKLAPVLKRTVAPMQKPGQGTGAPPETGAPRWKTWGIVTGAGLAAVGAGVGLGFSFAANAKNGAALEERDRLRQQREMNHVICPSAGNEPRCRTLAELANARDTYRNVAIAGFSVAGVGIAGALVSTLWRSNQPGRSADKGAAFSIMPSTQGVIVTGSF